MPCTVLYHPLALNPSALDIRHQLIKILVEWQIKSKNTHVLVIGNWAWGIARTYASGAHIFCWLEVS
ncbi:MAG: hypothetical protein V7L11_24730 [Nostoc sp.]|uniref:hypothetical protein n=1 Tax=Nostoc sp. TaxID=1180 RepID=UPI002FF46DEE